MANKKISQDVENEQDVDIEEPEVFQDGDYYTALVKVKGTKELVKIRGIVKELSYSGGYTLLNNQGGEETDCDDDEHGFSFEVFVESNTQTALERTGVKEFSVVTDKRVIKVIDNDQLPEIAGHRARRLKNGDISFGCGAIEVSQEDVTNWVKFMEKIQSMKGWEDFLDLNDRISSETSVGDLQDIDVKEVKKLLE
jgi:hypothetical protein